MTVAGRVVVTTSDVVVEVDEGESLMAAARRAGLRWPTTCGGEGTCGVCVVQVLEGADRVVAAAPPEAERLVQLRKAAPGFRLACQLKVTGDVRVDKRGVKAELADAG